MSGLKINFFVPHAHVEDQPKSNHIGHNGGTTVTDKGKGNPRNWHDAHRHSNIFKNLESVHTNEANGDQGAVKLLGCPGYFYDPIKEKGVETDEYQPPQHAQFLYDDGENKVGLLYRKELKLLLSAHEESLSEKTTGANGYFTVPHLIIAAEGKIFRMKKRIDPLLLMAGHEAVNDGDSQQKQAGKLREDFTVNASEKDHDDPHDSHDDGAAQIFFQNDEDKRASVEGGQEDSLPGPEGFVISGKIIGKKKDKGDFHQF